MAICPCLVTCMCVSRCFCFNGIVVFIVINSYWMRTTNNSHLPIKIKTTTCETIHTLDLYPSILDFVSSNDSMKIGACKFSNNGIWWIKRPIALHLKLFQVLAKLKDFLSYGKPRTTV